MCTDVDCCWLPLNPALPNVFVALNVLVGNPHGPSWVRVEVRSTPVRA